MAEPHEVFTPGAPINKKEFFAGRIDQIERVLETIPNPGRHPIIFGQRGVGKTSLANILTDLLPSVVAVKINCDSSDTFHSIWNRILQRTSVTFRTHAFGFKGDEIQNRTSLASFVGHSNEVSPSEVADILAMVKHKSLFILDEFDRLSSDTAKSNMADLIKNLSDNNSQVTVVLVGVGQSISDLVGEHPSIQRNLVQIEVPTMPPAEIRVIIDTGCKKLGITLDRNISPELVSLANGFPHYAHLLGLAIAKSCKQLDMQKLSMTNFQRVTCSIAVEDAIETYRQLFSQATRTSMASRYPQILCACAHAVHDDNGVFRATDVVDAMRLVFKDDVTVQSVVPALGEFCRNERGPVLAKVAFGTRSHYRFSDPMIRPFLRIKTTALLQDMQNY